MNTSPKTLTKSIILCFLIATLISTAGLLYLIFIDSNKNNQRLIDTTSQQVAQLQSNIINRDINNLQKRLDSIASNSELYVALNNNDQTEISKLTLSLRKALPESTSIKIIPITETGIAGLDNKNLNNNIELDIISKASKFIKTEPEAYKINGQWHFSLVAPIGKTAINDSDYARGVILASFNNYYLNNFLQAIDPTAGKLALIQNYGQAITLASSGNGSGKEITSPTEFKHWQISFQPSTIFEQQFTSNKNILWTILGACLLVNLTLLSFLIGKAKKVPVAINTKTENNAIAETATKANSEQAEAKPTSEKIIVPVEKNDISQAEKKQASINKTNTFQNNIAEVFDIPGELPAHIFRAYDIRGLADEELTDENCIAIGQAIGSMALEQNQTKIIVAADGRHSSPRIRDAMIEGLKNSGISVIDIGIQPTPLMYFATHQLDTQSGVIITGSHNPAEYNGIKIVIDGKTLTEQHILKLHKRIIEGDVQNGNGGYEVQGITDDYIDYISGDIAVAQPLKIVVDAGNGVTGNIAPQLLEELGCEVIRLYCDIDGDFPNHHPDPSISSNLLDLIQKVQDENADLGIAFDGDGDRLGVVSSSGNIIPADQLIMLFAQDVVSRNPGADIVFDVKCTRHLVRLISSYGGRPIMWKCGHSNIKEKMHETGALLGGEYTGHIFFKERWFGFDDALYAAARLIEILSISDPDIDNHIASLPQSCSSEEIFIDSTEDEKFVIIDQLLQNGLFADAKITNIDGLRADYDHGWGLVRASNTSPKLTMRFEADDEQSLENIKQTFKQEILKVAPHLTLTF